MTKASSQTKNDQAGITWVSDEELIAQGSAEKSSITAHLPSSEGLREDDLNDLTPSNISQKARLLSIITDLDNIASVMARIRIEDILGSPDFEGQLKEKLLSEFRKHGVPQTPATESMAAYTAHLTVMEKCREEWAKIPTYRDAKARGESATPLEHFDTHWRKYLEAGVLFQHIMREYDDLIVSNISSFLSRHPEIRKSSYAVPTISAYNDSLSKMLAPDLLNRMTAAKISIDRR